MNFQCGFDYRSTMYAYSAMFVEKNDVTHVCGCGGGGGDYYVGKIDLHRMCNYNYHKHRASTPEVVLYIGRIL